MAVRWGTGEEILTACNMDIFPLDTLDETTGLNSGDTMNTLQGCLDPSILSMFEDPSAIEIRGLEEESEATLLTALTEILDNVDDENLSPFDTLPESDLLSGQKGREHSPLRRLFCLSRSPPEKETLFGKHRFTGKTLPMVQQRSDGEEEEDSLIPSPGRFELTSDNQLLDWEGLPITFEQNSDGLSVSLGDLVRQMHPYCMAISLEDNEGEQMLPEGGILLEVVDQGVNGEPILAIPEMDHTISVKLDESVSNSEVLDEDDVASDSSEQIVVDDDDDIVKPLLKVPVIKTDSNVKDKIIFGELEKKDEIKDKTPFRRKKKSSNHLAASPPEPSESRVLRSASLKKASHEAPKKYENKLLKKDKRQKQNKSKLEDPTATTITCVNPKHLTVNQTNLSEDTISATSTILHISSEKTEMIQSVSPPVENVQQSESTQSPSVPASEQTAAPTASKDVSVEAAATPEVFQSTTVVGAPGPLLSRVPAEPKPKALSLAEYRRLRQQKKPAPVEKQDDISTKWPSLPEPPRELPPIPHLPEPSPRDPRLSRAQSKEMEEVKPAWMPRGPGAPPTPEALLAPPAYMVNSVNKAATKPQQTPPLHASAPLIPTKEPTKGDPNSVTNYPSSSATTTTEEIKPAANVLTSVSKTVASSEIKPQINQTDETPKCSGSCGQSSSSPVTHLKVVNQSSSGKSEECPVVKPVEAKSPTQKLIEAFSSEMGIEASDLTSLLEQFEETQAKEDQCLPEVSGRAVAVGNSSSIDFSDKMVVERIRTNDLSSTALTPPATPPHPLWKPLAPVSLLGKSKTTQTKSGSSRVIEIEAQPLPLTKAHNRLNTTASVDPDMACQDHDYCLPNKSTSCSEAAKRWNVKQHSLITIKPIKQTATPTLQNAQVPTIQPTTCKAKEQELGQKNANLETSSVLETPDASPTRDEDDNKTCPKRGQLVKSCHQRASSRTLSPKERSTGRSRVRRSHCSSSDSSESDSHSSRSRSRSYTPPRKRYRPRHSRSSSSSSSWSTSHSSSRSRSPPRQRRYSYSSSRSRSWSRSRSRSPQWSRKRHAYSPSYRDMYYTNVKSNPELKRRKEKAIEERRVVYVGRIRGTMTQKELKERFSYFGEIEECTLHFRDHGDNYGFVTYYNTNDAFMAIENGSKLRKPDEMPFDLCFGGRRQFCQTSYADLDSSKEYEPLLSRNKCHALDFDTLLKQAQQNLKR